MKPLFFLAGLLIGAGLATVVARDWYTQKYEYLMAQQALGLDKLRRAVQGPDYVRFEQ